MMMSLRLSFIGGLMCFVAALAALTTGSAAPAPVAPTSDFPQFVRVAGCELIKQDKVIVVKGPGGDRAHLLTT
jgi:hypothetical protein